LDGAVFLGHMGLVRERKPMHVSLVGGEALIRQVQNPHCVALRDNGENELQRKTSQNLSRYTFRRFALVADLKRLEESTGE
jgi:hypothetical protein